MCEPFVTHFSSLGSFLFLDKILAWSFFGKPFFGTRPCCLALWAPLVVEGGGGGDWGKVLLTTHTGIWSRQRGMRPSCTIPSPRPQALSKVRPTAGIVLETTSRNVHIQLISFLCLLFYFFQPAVFVETQPSPVLFSIHVHLHCNNVTLMQVQGRCIWRHDSVLSTRHRLPPKFWELPASQRAV